MIEPTWKEDYVADLALRFLEDDELERLIADISKFAHGLRKPFLHNSRQAYVDKERVARLFSLLCRPDQTRG